MSKLSNLIRDLSRELDAEGAIYRSAFDVIAAKYAERKPTPIPAKRKLPRKGKQTAIEIAEIRAKLYERCRGNCEAIGEDRSPKCEGYAPYYRGGEAAHIRSKARGGRFTLANLLWKCGPCHQFEHAGGKPCPKK